MLQVVEVRPNLLPIVLTKLEHLLIEVRGRDGVDSSLVIILLVQHHA